MADNLYIGQPYRGVTKVLLRDSLGVVVAMAEAWVEDGGAFPTDSGNTLIDRTVWEGSPGSVLTVNVLMTWTGAVQTPTGFEVTAWDMAGTQIGAAKSLPISNGVASQIALHFDADPFDGTHPVNTGRYGMIEIAVRLFSAGGLNPWSVSSREHTSPPNASTTADNRRARGYLRSKVPIKQALVGNSRSGGVPQAPLVMSYPDSVAQRFVLDPNAAPYTGHTLKVQHQNGAGNTIREQTSGVASTTFDFDWSAASGALARINRGNNGSAGLGGAYPSNGPVAGLLTLPTQDRLAGGDNEWAWNGSDIVGWSLTSPQVITHSALFTADASLTFTSHLQISDSVFGVAKACVPANRLSGDIGFVAARVLNARGEGQNNANAGQGISYSFVDENSLIAPDTSVNDAATATRDGQAGWGPLLPWTATLPAGDWINTVTFEDAAGIQGSAQHTYTLLGIDPRIVVMAGGGSNDDSGSHLLPGHALIAALVPVRVDTGMIIENGTEPQVALARLNTATRMLEHFDGAAWVATGGGEVTFFNAIRASVLHPAWDSRLFLRTFGPGGLTNVDTSTWNFDDIFVIGRIKVDGTTYGNYSQVTMAGYSNRHSMLNFDPTGLFS